ncbi:hypothetical protein BJY00DRAFT_253420 [Aspergillus carlsbadensis]|nr:hypothetical protein BJY00DRAFT_253420 [Aspergillus carlsbadensis]
MEITVKTCLTATLSSAVQLPSLLRSWLMQLLRCQEKIEGPHSETTIDLEVEPVDRFENEMQLVSSIQKSRSFAAHQSLAVTVFEIGTRSSTRWGQSTGTLHLVPEALNSLSNDTSFVEHSLESKWAGPQNPKGTARAPPRRSRLWLNRYWYLASCEDILIIIIVCPGL